MVKRGLGVVLDGAMALADAIEGVGENCSEPKEAALQWKTFKRNKKNTSKSENLWVLSSGASMDEDEEYIAKALHNGKIVTAEKGGSSASKVTHTSNSEQLEIDTNGRDRGNTKVGEEDGKKKIGNEETGKESLRYPANHDGKPWVLFDTSRSEIIQKKGIRNGLYLWAKIKGCNIEGIDTIRAIGVTLYKVLFENVFYANRCLNNEKLKSANIRTFIPRSFLETYGVIRNIPVEYSDAEIRSGLKSVVDVTSIQRFTRRENNECENRVPTLSVKIGFAGDQLPKEVILDHTILEVTQFFPMLRQCYKCGRIGHTQKTCRSEKRCLKCGNKGGCVTNCGIPMCVLCGDAKHNAFDRVNCPTWEKENNIIKIMTLKKQTRREVLTEYKASTGNRFELLSDDHFPGLDNELNPFRDNQCEVNRIMTPNTYASQVKKNSQKPYRRNIPQERPVRQKATQQNQQKNGVAFSQPNLHAVSELEKITTEMSKFARDAFRQINFPAGVNAFVHFRERLKQQFSNFELKNVAERGEVENSQHEDSSI
ncbi:uncharacterized protein LOC118754563 [Rhagoletis pomonella]|uniref:uncharacterized protein LOC118754563 n=1 Tax=Rhagoletis pomonella TaxID=28610 RepID=UPI00177B9183|nr:uncharacterized protein LOC118754563 [Rhagoletis pomonella]